MCLPTWASPVFPQKSYGNGNQLAAQLHPQGWGDCAPPPHPSLWAAVVSTASWRCWWKTLRSGSIAQALMHEWWWKQAMSYSEPLSHLQLPWPSVDPICWLNKLNAFKRPQLTAKRNNALLKLYLFYIMYVTYNNRTGADMLNFHHLNSSEKLNRTLSKSHSVENTRV